MLKTGSIIPIRLASERLPNKALMPIVSRPVVWHLLDRVCASKYIKDKKDVVVCTTCEQSDDALVSAVEQYGCSCFRGSADDIIKRFYDAILTHQFDAIIQVDGDDPLSDTHYMDRTMELLLGDASLDIVTCEGLPLGVAVKSFTKKAIQRVYGHYKSERNDTGFIYYFTKTGLCKQDVVKVENPNHVLNEARLTLDYKEDFEVFKRIFEALYVKGQIFSLDEVVLFLKSRPEIMNINSVLNGEYWMRTQEKAKLQYITEDGVTKNIE